MIGGSPGFGILLAKSPEEGSWLQREEWLKVDKGDPSRLGDADLSAERRRKAVGSERSVAQELTELYESTAASLFRYGLVLTQNGSLVQDGIQETFLKYYLQRLGGEPSPGRAWFFRVLRNYILDQQKSTGAKMAVSLEDVHPDQSSSGSPEHMVQRSQALRLALQVLTPREIQCLQLRREGFSYKEIASILGIRKGTVGALLTRSSDKIRKAFGEEGLPCEVL